MAETKKHTSDSPEKKSSALKTVLAGEESEKLQREGWTVVNMYTNPENPLQRYHDLEQTNKN